ncbi:hypothetical protein ONS95_005369 [Cadophora gregata]|uniref:uncharacterized protein n=1 Tax=Cadophora gregata TaxID=51156 RepID=UPI0026DCF465|nr:uncharacterized protein ONS95_005369 [Cadophora gregata]KAK0103343.1 hypothetical protein ONS95_005369 [Cadophora gregata]
MASPATNVAQSVELGELDDGTFEHLPSTTIAETIWAISYFIYTGDNEVRFTRTTAKRLNNSRSDVASRKWLSCIRSYQVDLNATPAEIAKSGREMAPEIREDAQEHQTGPSSLALTQIVRQTELLFAQGDEVSEWRDYAKRNNPHSMIFCVSMVESLAKGILFANSHELQEKLADIADTLQQVSELVQKNWSSPLSQLSFMGPANWNRITRLAPTPVAVGESVMCDILDYQRQVRPECIAVDAWDGSFTYAELHSYSLRMATLLLQRGVTPEERIGICIKKSKWAAIAIWGTLLAGCTCVTIEIRNTRKRMETILKQVGARFVVADEFTAPVMDTLGLRTLRCQSDALEAIDASNSALAWPEILPSTMAYIIFTSGSTGIPKGVMVDHGPLYQSTVELAEAFHVEETSKFFQYSGFSFDVAMSDMFTTMLKGGCLYIPSEEDRLDNLSLVLGESKATHATLTSTVMMQIRPEDTPHLRYVIAVGESLSRENFRRLSPHMRVMSSWGTTETVLFDTVAEPEHLASDYYNGGLPKGPCVWVVEPSDPSKPKPIGAIGELMVEGPLVTRGYVGDSERTAQKLIQAPSWLKSFRGKQEEHLCFLTGDHGVLNGDGTVSYAGRGDRQVKVRGQRVELGEIEHAIRVVEPVLDQVAVEAVKLQTRNNSQALVAFVSQRDRCHQESLSELLPMDEESKRIFRVVQSRLLEYLPRYMVPSTFIPVPALPKTMTGKSNRKALQQWGASLSEKQLSSYQLRDTLISRSPATPDEELLLRIWAGLLQIPETSLGAEDNFFQIGGDSVKAIELVAALRDCGRALTVAQVFQNPQMSNLANFLEYVNEASADHKSPEPFELLPGFVNEQGAVQEAARVCQVGEDMIEDIYPTTPMQEALMAISAHRSRTYTHRAIFRIPGSLDMARFKQSWEILVSEQPILRTRIIALPSAGTMQVVLREGVEWHTNLTLDAFVEHDDETTFRYGSALSRYAIVRNDTDNLFFVWSSHHAISDGWSRPAMFNELKYIYHHGIAHLQKPYSLFISYLNRLNLPESSEFWKDQFPDIVEGFPRLPSPDYVPQAQQKRSLRIDLHRETASQITTTSLVQAAWAFVTATYADADEAVFGLTLSGRDAPVQGITRMMGITITTVPVRVILDNTMTILEYLEEVQQYILQVKQHQHVGLQQIYRLSSEARSAANFQNLLVVQPTSEEEDYRGLLDMGLELSQREERDTGNHALLVQCVINEESRLLQVDAYFDDKCISVQQVECMLYLFEHILGQLASESTGRSLYDLDRMSPHDLGLLGEINGQMPLAVERTLHGLFQERVRESPDAVALDGFDGQLTYAELDRISDQLAHHIHLNAGVGVESRVVLCFAKSTIPVVAILGTLKAGGVCISINPEHPTVRLIELCEEVEADIVLCDEANVDRFQSHVAHVLGITNSLLQEFKSATVSRPDLATVLPSNASFVIFTSGSTGKPKASVLEHRSLATDLIGLGERVCWSPQSRTLQFSAYTFDAHIVEIIGTLIHGGCVCIISDHERMNFLSDAINERRANWALLTKTVSRLLEPEEVPTLKHLILSGEPNGRQDYWRWATHLRLLNGMGPSECTPLVCVTRPVTPTDDPANIGSAVGCHLWVTDRRRQDRLVPIGCVGELLVEGPIVGRGYVNRPKENTAAFIHNPAWSQDGSGRSRRFYRSGDLAKMNVDGSIVFIGRADGQVKIHGQRVELGEIEDHIRRCNPSFPTSAVDVLKFSRRGGTSALAVFWIHDRNGQAESSNGADVDRATLCMDDNTVSESQKVQARLADLLPQYMVPSIFIPVRYLPFNASGKLERRKLREWVAALDTHELGDYFLSSRTKSRPPETNMEKRLQALWAKVLDVPMNTISARENFFRAGGDSVLSIKLIADARAEGIAMTVADVFRMPLLEDMALTMLDLSKVKAKMAITDTDVEPFWLIKDQISPPTAIKEAAEDCNTTPELIEDIYPCTPIQEALMAASSHQAEAYTYDVILRLPRSMDLGRFKSSWEKLVTAHAIFRTRIVFKRGIGSLQVVLRSTITWHSIKGIPVDRYLAQDPPLLVEYGSELCRFSLIESDGETVFVGKFHHALYDGWSLMRTYEAFGCIFLHGALPQPAIPYNRFLSYLSATEADKSDAFWRSQFTTIVETYPRSPYGHTPRPGQSRSATIPFKRRLTSDVTAATVIQTAWALLMALYTGNEADVIFGQTFSGRDAPVDGITHIIGPTLTSVPVRVPLEWDSTVADLLCSVQKITADIRKHQHVGLQHIRRLSPEAKAATEFQNLLIVHTMGDAEITSPMSSLGIEIVKSKAEESSDLALTAECTIMQPDILHTLITYDAVLVPDQQVELMLRQLEHTVSVLLEESSSTKLRNLDLVSPCDLDHLIGWNRVTKYANETLHELVEAQARATPDAVATSGFDGEYTYQKLDATADRLAAYLGSKGVGPEKRVVLSFRKSTWPIIAMLAVLKCGGVCVSVNFEHPLSRRLDIVQDLEPVVILCDSDQETEYLQHHQQIVTVNDALFDDKISEGPSDWMRPKVRPENAAFIVYTSGSTGKPKGCILEHHAVCLSQKINARTMRITRQTRALQFATYTWDPSILEIFGTLIQGGCVVVISDDERMNNLTEVINARRVTWTFQTPTVAQVISPKAVPTLETVVFCGEPLTQKVVRRWSADTNAQLINFYSAAETANIGTINFNPDAQDGLISIGKANGCGLWIVDRNNSDQLVPVGCVGELLIEGHAVVRGYWRRPEANNAAFIENPLWSKSQAEAPQSRRFYKTGDIAYFNPDGSVQLLGRADKQVKIRGQRVELSEIEYQIHQQLPQGSEVTVDIVDWGTSTLTSFIRLPTFAFHHQEDGLLVVRKEELEHFQEVVKNLLQLLPEKLPQYMVPLVFVPVSMTPKLASTKTDRKRLKEFAQSLPKDEFVSGGLSVAKEPPRDNVEAILQLVWSQILKQDLDDIGIHDSFISLGGDSIIAMQSVSECRRLGLKLLVSTILKERTIAAIAPLCTPLHFSIEPGSKSTTLKEELAHPKRFPYLDVADKELESLLSELNIILELGGCEDEVDIIEDIYPCTIMQEGILFSQQKDSEAYQIECVWEFTDHASLKDNLPQRMTQAWNTIIQRHTSLRTCIIEHATEQKQFVQVVLKNHPHSRFTIAEELIDTTSETPAFHECGQNDLWPYLPRLALFCTANGRVACRLNISHVLVDGISVDLFINELLQLLVGSDLGSSAMDFAAYINYEQNLEQDQSIKYWADFLKEVQPCHLPTLERGMKRHSESREYDYITLSEDAANSLAPFCQRLGITQAVLIQTAWAIVLGVFTDRQDVCFGYIASTRDSPLDRIQETIGLFISMQVCRVQIDGIAKDLLRKVQSDVIGGLDSRHCSLALIQNMLGLKGVPLFNTCVTIRGAIDATTSTQRAGLIKTITGVAKTEFAINLDATITPSGAEISMTYQKSMVSLEYVNSIAGSLEIVLQGLLKAENQPVCCLEVVGRHDRTTLEQWNSSPLESVDATLHGLFEQQARATPDALAIHSLDGQYTYAQLNTMAEKLAGLLMARGVKPEDRVVLYFANSSWLLISMLATLKIGGICVLTPPEVASGHLLEICKDTKPHLVLSDDQNAPRFHGHASHVISINESLFEQLKVQHKWTSPTVQPTNAAFAVYASRHNGELQGCIFEHHSVCKSQLENIRAFNITKSTRAIQISLNSQCSSIGEMFAPLLAGACVYVTSDDECKGDLARLINEKKAEWIMLPSAMARCLLPSDVPTIKTLILSGKSLSQQAVETWHGNGVHLASYWTPSEGFGSVCINTEVAVHTDPMQIGRASGCRIWITRRDRPQNLLPIGCVGEILVEGPMIGRGYVDKPAITEADFVTDLNWSNDGLGHSRRFYRTGELGQFEPNGSVILVGQPGDLVDIQGRRVGLNRIRHEITESLAPGSEAAVLVVAERLVAFVKLDVFSSVEMQATTSIEVEDLESKQVFQGEMDLLRLSLAGTLPPHMVPSIYVPVSSIPTTPLVAEARRQLENLARSLIGKSELLQEEVSNKKQPRNDMERDLQRVWAEVLHQPTSRIGMDDTFMSLGGDSLAAMRTVGQCRKIGIKVTVLMLFRDNNIAAIAEKCSMASTAAVHSRQLIETVDGQHFRLSPIQKRYMELEPGNSGVLNNQSIFCRVRKSVTAAQVRAAFEIIVDHHAMLRARFSQSSNGEWQQATMAPGSGSYRFRAHSLQSMDEESITQYANEAGSSLNIITGPIFSVDFFQISSQDGTVFLTAHHLVIDIVSWQLILRDFEDYMESGKLMSSSDITWQQWCSMQEAEARSQTSAGHVFPLVVPPNMFQYWEVPANENIFADEVVQCFELPAVTTDLVLGKSNLAMGFTSLDILLGSLLSAFHQVFPDRDVPSVNIEHHGRESCEGADVDLSQVVGWFTTMYPVHVAFEASTTSIDATQLVMEQRRRIPRNGRPYFAYRHLNADGAATFTDHEPLELLVNYTGVFQQNGSSDSAIQLDSRIKNTVIDIDKQHHRWAMIDVEIGVYVGIMSVSFHLNRKMRHFDRIQQWIERYRLIVMETAHALSKKSSQRSLGDFPLLDIGSDQLNTLLSKDLPQLGIDSLDNVEDILPLSPFQKYSIESNLAAPARHWITYYVDLPLDVDVARLRHACIDIVRHYSILRTIFVRHGRGFLQVVLKHVEPPVEFYQSRDDEIAEFMARVFQTDLDGLSPLGHPIVHFMVLRTPKHARLLLRCSHAQLDALSRTGFIRTFVPLYEGRSTPLLPSVGYSEFMRHARQHRQEGISYWRMLLSGAKPTTIVNAADPPAFEDTGLIRVERMMPQLRSLDNVTSASVFNAACALLLRSMTKSPDVTFGRITSGRTALDPELHDMVGPCTDIIPVRVQFRDGGSRPLDIVREVHQQFVNSIPYETVGLDDIIRDCTNWSTSMAKFPVITQHINHEEESAAELSTGGEFQLNVWDPVDADPFPWSFCLAAFPSRAGVRISLAANTRYIEPAVIEQALKGLCAILESLAQHRDV